MVFCSPKISWTAKHKSENASDSNRRRQHANFGVGPEILVRGSADTYAPHKFLCATKISCTPKTQQWMQAAAREEITEYNVQIYGWIRNPSSRICRGFVLVWISRHTVCVGGDSLFPTEIRTRAWNRTRCYLSTCEKLVLGFNPPLFVCYTFVWE